MKPAFTIYDEVMCSSDGYGIFFRKRSDAALQKLTTRLLAYGLLILLLLTGGSLPCRLEAAGLVNLPQTAVRKDVAVFDESFEWATSRAATNSIVAELVAIGAGIYVPIVWHGRGTLYPSPIAHADARLSRVVDLNKSDPLAYLIERAHANGIEVHPWFTVMKREDEKFPRFFERGTPTGAFDLHIPDFREFMVRLISDLAKRYPVDGINLDYIRSMGLCQSRACTSSYQASTGEQLSTDLKRRFLPHVRDRIGEWNESAIEEFLVALRKQLPPDMPLSIDAHPLERITEEQGQYSIKWANSRLIDRVYDMRYAKDLNFEKLNAIREGFKDDYKLWVLLSNADKTSDGWETRDAQAFKNQIMSLRRWQPGIGIGIWHRPRFSDEQRAVLASMKTSE